jgi:hypothetical protein
VSLRLLVTARDAGATFNLIEIARAALRDGDFSLSIHAQSPALEYLREAGLDAIDVALPPASDAGDGAARALLEYARAVQLSVQPDALLAGLSTPGDGGIDEAALATAVAPSFVMQDFWGEANGFFGRLADCYLGLDEHAVRLTRQRHGVDGAVVGSPRHAAYATLDVEELRARSRTELGLAEGVDVFGLFGQALHRLPGYQMTVEAWAAALRRLPGPLAAVYRPHPRETDADAAATLALVRGSGLECRLVRQRTVEETLAACDVVCSAFSLCSYDAAYLNRLATRPLITPVTLLFDQQVRDYCGEHIHFEDFPYLQGRLALSVRRVEELGERLQSARHGHLPESVWRAARGIPDPSGATARALEVIRRRVSGQRADAPDVGPAEDV